MNQADLDQLVALHTAAEQTDALADLDNWRAALLAAAPDLIRLARAGLEAEGRADDLRDLRALRDAAVRWAEAKEALARAPLQGLDGYEERDEVEEAEQALFALLAAQAEEERA